MTEPQTLAPQLVDRKGRLWQERTVVVKKESDGFGFTLSKEMPVFVDVVTPGSSADRAGILAGDRIIKVNAVSVMGHKHHEVVEMIRDSTHVTLTVIGKLPQNGTRGPGREHGLEISPPRQLQELTLQSLKVMLQRQRKTYESLSVDYSKSPSDKLEKELHDCESIVKILEAEIASKSPSIEAHINTTSASIMALTGKHPRTTAVDDQVLRRKLLGCRPGEEEQDGPSARRYLTPSASPTKGFYNTGKSDSPKPMRANTFSNGTISPTKGWHLRKQPSIPGSVLGHTEFSDLSDDDLSDEVDGASEAGPFSSLQELRNNPAHMAVFLHYLYSNKEPKYLLFFLVAYSFQNYCKSVDLRQRGMDIFWTFFLESSPLPLEVDDEMKSKILSTLESDEITENIMRSVFVPVRESLSETIINDLAQYRHKRVIGMAGMFGDHLLTNQMSPTRQIEVMQSTLLPDLKQCLEDKGYSTVFTEEATRNQAIAACIATFMLDMYAIVKVRDKTTVSPLDKVQSFTRGDVNAKKGKGGRKKSSVTTKCGHSFDLATYQRPTACDFCGKLLWGVMYHGYQCRTCELNVHRYCCVGELVDTCSGKNFKKQRKMSAPVRKSSMSILVTPDDVDADSAFRREEEEAERLSPPTENASGLSRSEEEQLKRDRSESEPHHAMLVQSVSTYGGEPPPTHLEPRRTSKGSQPITRTQSEKLQSKPDTVPVKHLQTLGPDSSAYSLMSTTSSSDESIIGGTSKGGSLEAIVERKGPVVEEDLSELMDDQIEDEPMPFMLSAKREVLAGMKRYEVQRQENIKELMYTERNHVHRLKIMRYIYKLPLMKQNILSVKQVEQLFPSLEELILFHGGLCADLMERVAASPNSVVKNIADVLLQRFDGNAGERLCHACSVFASNQAKADQLFKEWKRKNERFRLFVKNAESHPLCQKLTLNELMPIAWQRLTKYKLLIDTILSTYRKHFDELSDADREEAQKVETALSCVKNILQYVNRQVRRAENKQRLLDYQSKLDVSSLEKASHPIAQLFKSFDLGAENRRLVHEGLLTWRVQHRKVVELHALLLTDVLVLLEKHEDKDKYYLRCHTLENINGVKEELSPIIRLQDCLLRHAAADRGGRTFLLVNNSSLMKLAQMYEFIAEGPKEKKQWEEAIKRAMMGTQAVLSPELPSSPTADDFPGRLPLGLSPLTSHYTLREQLDKIDDDMKKLLTDKLTILRATQGGIDQSLEAIPLHRVSKTTNRSTPKDIISLAIEQAGEVNAIISHIMVPNPTKSIIAETQSRVADIVTEMQRNLSKLLVIMEGGPTTTASTSSLPVLLPSESLELKSNDGTMSSSQEDLVQDDLEVEDVFKEQGLPVIPSIVEDHFQLPPPLPDDSPTKGPPFVQDADLLTSEGWESFEHPQGEAPGGGVIVAPPECFSGEESATPTPQMETESTGRDSDSITPRTSPIISPTSISPSYEEMHGSTGRNRHTLEPPVDHRAAKRDSIGPGIKILTVVSSEDHNLQPSEQEEDSVDSVHSYTLSRARQMSTTSSDSETLDLAQQPEREDMNTIAEEGTDL